MIDEAVAKQLPQLGATGVAAHTVRRDAGFRVIWGPVRAADLPAFLDARLRATPAMREVTFPLRERLVLAQVPRLFAGPPIAFIVAGMLAMAFMGFSGIATS